MAVAEAGRADASYDDVRSWLMTSRPPVDTPVAAEVWVLTPDLSKVLLVQHRWRGWVPPGGKVDPGEHPREAARRELLEETGLLMDPHPAPAAAAVRRFHPEWSQTLALSYAAVTAEVPCQGEPGQPAQWMPVIGDWSTYFPGDAARVRRHAHRVAAGAIIVPVDEAAAAEAWVQTELERARAAYRRRPPGPHDLTLEQYESQLRSRAESCLRSVGHYVGLPLGDALARAAAEGESLCVHRGPTGHRNDWRSNRVHVEVDGEDRVMSAARDRAPWSRA
jgi:8-oxo-dGTP diphosphatase